MVHQEVPEGGSEGAEALEGKEVRWRVVFGDVGVDGLEDEGVLGEEEGGFGVYAEEQQRVDGVYCFLAIAALETHYQVLHLGHHRVQLGPLQVAYARSLINLFIVLLKLTCK